MKLNYNTPNVEVIKIEGEGVIMATSSDYGTPGETGNGKQSVAPVNVNLGGFSKSSYEK